MFRKDHPVIKWLLQGDPAIRWQVLRDLADAPHEVVERERRKTAREGWGARLLAEQGDDGRWQGQRSRLSGMYTPKWTSTHYTMLLLRDIGLPPTNQRANTACGLLLERGLYDDGGIGYGFGSETCVTGMVLSILSYFRYDDERLDRLVGHLLKHQMSDGGWNCRWPRGATHSSVHTTISVLEGLRHYEVHRDRQRLAVQRAQQRGREFLLVHRLFRSHRTGAVIKPVFMRFAFPPYWHFDILRGLDYFRDVDAPRDCRLGDAIEVVRKTRLPDGRWTLQNSFPGKTYFDMERRGQPSRWNTLRALRVLRWWEGDQPVRHPRTRNN